MNYNFCYWNFFISPFLQGAIVLICARFTKGPPSRVGHTKKLFYNKMNLINGFGKYNFFGGCRVPLGRSGGTRPPPGWP